MHDKDAYNPTERFLSGSNWDNVHNIKWHWISFAASIK